ncbi:MAG TPA: glycosyltransferase, partial [Candidatus Polarisedimenticolia bacterium]|nr:glycosyltransferase [Candidatus Polarisedimenticolia bacterium]
MSAPASPPHPVEAPSSAPPRAHEDRARVLAVITNFHIGGTERQFLALARRLDRRRFALSAACLRREGPLLPEMQKAAVPVEEHRIRSLYHPRTVGDQVRLASSLRRRRVHIVHTYGFYPNAFAVPAARLAATPVVIASIRDIGDIWTPLQRRLQKAACRLAHCIAVNAEAVKDRLVGEGYDPRRIVVIGNGIDLERFRRRGAAPGLRAELGLPSDAVLIGVVSRLIPGKGLSHFLKAAAALAPRWPAARFLLIGDGPARPQLQDEARALGLGGRVAFTGFRSDVAEVLSELALSVMPSLSEALSNGLLESMAAGVPVVATRVGGTPEVVREGTTGLLVPPADAGALARAVEALLSNPERATALGLEGRELVSRRFSMQRMVERTELLYASLLEDALR